ncbi:MAG: hypothetical protein M1827_004949 [Pycnora praestabilis]|nr:MAG: hypothetical protein M1827_004949 [Pycnora praestabilis]
MESKISSIHASQRLDSRGNPTVQVRVRTEKSTFQAIVPSGASKGDYEAVELRDGDKEAYHGSGVLKAVSNVNNIIAPALIEKGFHVATDLAKIDHFMIWNGWHEGQEKGVPLYEHIRELSGTLKPYIMPVPFFNVLNGGVHSGNTMAFQELMIAPIGAGSLTDAVRMGSEVYQELKSVVKAKYGPSAIGIGDEGGFAPPISRPSEALDLLVTAFENCGYTGKMKIGIDPASSEFLFDKIYDLGFKDKSSNDEKLSAKELSSLYKELMRDYPIVLLEDPFGQDD